MTTPPNLYANFKPIAFTLSAERENAILEQTAKDIAESLTPDILTAFPNFQLPEMQMPNAKQRLGMYTQATDAQDFPMLKDPDYVKKMQQGLLPPPVSPFWNGLAGLPPVFEHVQKDFIHVMNTLVGDLKGDD